VPFESAYLEDYNEAVSPSRVDSQASTVKLKLRVLFSLAYSVVPLEVLLPVLKLGRRVDSAGRRQLSTMTARTIAVRQGRVEGEANHCSHCSHESARVGGGEQNCCLEDYH
jgi:hypothetical protein